MSAARGGCEQQPATHVYFDFFGTLVAYDPSVLPAERNAPHEFTERAGLGLSSETASALWSRAWTELDTAAEQSGRECSLHEIARRFAELAVSAAATVARPADRAARAASPAPHPAGQAPPEAELDRLVADYLEAWTAGIRLADGARECLDTLLPDHTLAVVSNTHHAPLVPGLLARYGIADAFADVFTSIELGWRKPRPEIFHEVLGAHGIPAAAAVFVGDNWDADVTGPSAVGMRALYVGAQGPGREPIALRDVPEHVRAPGQPRP